MWSLGLYIASLFLSIIGCGLCGVYLFSSLLPMLKITTSSDALTLLINGYCLDTGGSTRCVLRPFNQQFENILGPLSFTQPSTGSSLTAETLVRDYPLLSQPTSFLTCFIIFILIGLVIVLLAFNTSSGRIPTKFVRGLLSTILVLSSFISAAFIGIVVVYYGKLGEQDSSRQVTLNVEKGLGQYLLSIVLATTVIVTILILWKSCVRRKDHSLNEPLKTEPWRASTVSHSVPLNMTSEQDSKEQNTLTRWNPDAHYLQYEDPYMMYNTQNNGHMGYSMAPLYYVPSYSTPTEAGNGNMYRPYSMMSTTGMMPYVSNYSGNEMGYSGSSIQRQSMIIQQGQEQVTNDDNEVIASQSMAPVPEKEDPRFTAAPSEFAPFK